MTDVQPELLTTVENLRARVKEIQQSGRPLSPADFADTIEELATAVAGIHAELQTLKRK